MYIYIYRSKQRKICVLGNDPFSDLILNFFSWKILLYIYIYIVSRNNLNSNSNQASDHVWSLQKYKFTDNILSFRPIYKNNWNLINGMKKIGLNYSWEPFNAGALILTICIPFKRSSMIKKQKKTRD